MILSFTVGILCLSCQKEKTPADILPPEQLTNIMIDFYLGEARLMQYSLKLDSAKKLFIPFEDSVLKKYGVTDTLLQKTYQYYFDHPTELEKIYEAVVDSLSLQERKADVPAVQN